MSCPICNNLYDETCRHVQGGVYCGLIGHRLSYDELIGNQSGYSSLYDLCTSLKASRALVNTIAGYVSSGDAFKAQDEAIKKAIKELE